MWVYTGSGDSWRARKATRARERGLRTLRNTDACRRPSRQDINYGRVRREIHARDAGYLRVQCASQIRSRVRLVNNSPIPYPLASSKDYYLTSKYEIPAQGDCSVGLTPLPDKRIKASHGHKVIAIGPYSGIARMSYDRCIYPCITTPRPLPFTNPTRTTRHQHAGVAAPPRCCRFACTSSPRSSTRPPSGFLCSLLLSRSVEC